LLRSSLPHRISRQRCQRGYRHHRPFNLPRPQLKAESITFIRAFKAKSGYPYAATKTVEQNSYNGGEEVER